MTISPGASLPDATLLQIGANGPEGVPLAPRLAGRKVVIFGLPGAYTGTCTSAHVPSFIRTKAALSAKGVDEVICISVNDPFVMKSWGEATGATAAGITLLGDTDAAFTKAIGMAFSVPAIGFFDRSKRYALLAEDGVVKVLNVDENAGECNLSAGETLLDQI